jgi:hypothetical protein
LAEAVIAASGATAPLTTPDDAVIQNFVSNIIRSVPTAVSISHSTLEKIVRSEMTRMADRVAKDEVDIYARRFTQAQLEDILAFYRTDGGRALLSQMLAIQKEARDLLQVQQDEGDLLPDMMIATCAKISCQSRPSPGAPIPAGEAYAGDPWAERPSAEASVRLIPRMQSKFGFESADARCQVGSGGRLENCVIDWESVLDVGLDKAAIQAIELSALKPRLLDGSDPLSLYAQLTVGFDLKSTPSPLVRLQLHSLSVEMPKPGPHPFDTRVRQKSTP